MYIGPASSAFGPARRLLSARPLGRDIVERFADVYRALARICRAQAPPDSVIVVACVDSLVVDEMEFFSLLTARRLARKVYVFSEDPASPRVERALQAGAAERLTGQAVDELLARGEATPREPIEAVGASRPRMAVHFPPTDDDEEPSLSPSEESASARSAAAEESKNRAAPSDADEDSAVRVPWQSYADRPKRIAPGDRVRETPEKLGAGETGGAADRRNRQIAARLDDVDEPVGLREPDEADEAAGEAASRESAHPRGPESSRVRRPLLTEEELRALLGEDFFNSTHGA